MPQLGQLLDVSVFDEVKKVRVTGISKGKGYQGGHHDGTISAVVAQRTVAVSTGGRVLSDVALFLGVSIRASAWVATWAVIA